MLEFRLQPRYLQSTEEERLLEPALATRVVIMDSVIKEIRQALDAYVRRTKDSREGVRITDAENEVRVERDYSTFGGVNLRGATIFTRSEPKIIVTRQTKSGAKQELLTAEIIPLTGGGNQFRLDGKELTAPEFVTRALSDWDIRQ